MVRYGILAALLLAPACGGDGSEANAGGGGAGGPGGPGAGGGSGMCNENPWSCPSGQTCWIASEGNAFECLNSGVGQAGDECINYIDNPTCGDGLVCLQLQGQSGGTCTTYCDPKDPQRACPAGVACLSIQTSSGLKFNACEPQESTTTSSSSTTTTTTTTGAGGDGGTGAGGAGGSDGGNGGEGGS